MIQVGQRVKFDPFGCIMGFGIQDQRSWVTGTVVMVNEKHKWFSVVYGDPVMRTSFSFWDIGKEVKICGRI